VALGIFVVHVTVMTVLIVWSFGYGAVVNKFEIFQDNINTPFPEVLSQNGSTLSNKDAMGALFFGYCSALLGITGFETAANYVEQMESSKTFIKTVNWLW
jgi:amino acid transporter